MTHKKKGQFAIEMMASYGWALMIIMIMLGALVYFMPSTKTLTGKRCFMSSGMTCLGTSLSSDNLTISARNSFGQTIYNVSAETTIPKVVTCSVSNTTLRADEIVMIVCDNTGGLDVTGDARVGIIITYKKIKEGYNMTSKGDIHAKYT
jgi:hypothetical protein